MSSFLVFLEFQKQNREERGQKKKLQTYQFTQGYNILHRLQVHHLTLTLSYTMNINMNTIFIYIHGGIWRNNKTWDITKNRLTI